jgi:hypothetical protein
MGWSARYNKKAGALAPTFQLRYEEIILLKMNPLS